MSKQQYFLAFLATNLLLGLTNQSAMGFTLKFGKGAINYYNPTVPYVIDANTRGTTFLSPRYVAPIKLGGTNDFLKMLNNDVRWRGWDFISSDKNLYGNFEISRYYACGAQTLCAKERPEDKIRGGVGAYIDLKYNPKKTDPKPQQGKIHWIQRIVNNHTIYDEQQSTSSGGIHGVRYDGIDIPIRQNLNPYYRGGNEKSVLSGEEKNFTAFDRPYRKDPKNPHFWVGELYLVEEIAPKTAKIYNGIRWGWINRVYRRENPVFCPANNEKNIGKCPISTGFYTDLIGGGIGSSPIEYTPNDDSSFGSFKLGFSFNFFGQTYNDFYINNNGNISFGSPIREYTPNSLNTQTSAPMIAPYWADVDTRGGGNITVRTDIPNQAIVTWDKVGYYNQHTDKTASFQLVLRGEDYPILPGEDNVGFFYKDIQWETGDASGGTGGFNGTQAAVGFSDGLSSVNPGEFTLTGSQQPSISQLVSNKHYWFNTSINNNSNSDGIFDNEDVNQQISYLNPDGINWTEDEELSSFNIDDGNWIEVQDPSLLEFENFDWTSDNEALSDDSESPASVPEPTPVIGLLALSMWGMMKRLKFRFSTEQ